MGPWAIIPSLSLPRHRKSPCVATIPGGGRYAEGAIALLRASVHNREPCCQLAKFAQGRARIAQAWQLVDALAISVLPGHHIWKLRKDAMLDTQALLLAHLHLEGHINDERGQVSYLLVALAADQHRTLYRAAVILGDKDQRGQREFFAASAAPGDNLSSLNHLTSIDISSHAVISVVMYRHHALLLPLLGICYS